MSKTTVRYVHTFKALLLNASAMLFDDDYLADTPEDAILADTVGYLVSWMARLDGDYAKPFMLRAAATACNVCDLPAEADVIQALVDAVSEGKELADAF